MDQNNQNQSGTAPQGSAEIGIVRNSSATFGNVPQNAETFGTIQQVSEDFRKVPQLSERKENHTLTVREVARLFEAAGVARSERSIVNWCQSNRQGISRLDSYFDPNERKYFITPQSLEAAIAEEKAKAAAKSSQPPDALGTFGTIPGAEERSSARSGGSEIADERTRELERENLVLTCNVSR
jgi:hypothetical protein